MTLTTEQLRARAAAYRTDAATLAELGDTASSQRLNESANAFDELAANREAQPVKWGAPKTVGQMIGQLKTLDPAMETTALLRMPPDILDGNAVRQVPISISFEKLNGQWLAPYKGEGRKVLAFWAKADHREETERGELFTATPAPAPAVPEGWIACSDRMPQDGEHVLVSDLVGMEVSWIRGGEWKKLRHMHGDDVTHWMPLPAAPEGGNG